MAGPVILAAFLVFEQSRGHAGATESVRVTWWRVSRVFCSNAQSRQGAARRHN